MCDHKAQMTKFDADTFYDAVVDWAKKEVSSATDVRFDAAKFLFSVSTATLGFVTAAWKNFHDKAPITSPLYWSVFFLCVSVVSAMYMFWPVFYRFGSRTNIEAAHNRLVRRFVYEGAVWAGLWLAGVGTGL